MTTFFDYINSSWLQLIATLFPSWSAVDLHSELSENENSRKFKIRTWIIKLCQNLVCDSEVSDWGQTENLMEKARQPKNNFHTLDISDGYANMQPHLGSTPRCFEWRMIKSSSTSFCCNLRWGAGSSTGSLSTWASLHSSTKRVWAETFGGRPTKRQSSLRETDLRRSGLKLVLRSRNVFLNTSCLRRLCLSHLSCAPKMNANKRNFRN
jgi:hypothetical protein